MKVEEVSNEFCKCFLDNYHPLGTKGSLKGAIIRLAGFEDEWPAFLAVFVYPRSRWKNYPVKLELSRLAWSPSAKRSASTFLRKCLRILKRNHSGLVVTYALPGTKGLIYERAGFTRNGNSSGASWDQRGPGERRTQKTIGDRKKLKRFFAEL